MGDNSIEYHLNFKIAVKMFYNSTAAASYTDCIELAKKIDFDKSPPPPTDETDDFYDYKMIEWLIQCKQKE